MVKEGKMRKKSLFVLIVLFIIFFLSISYCYADVKTVYIEFTYSGQTPDEFRVYCNNILVYKFLPNQREGDFVVDINKNRPIFVVAAVVGGIEFRSPEYVYKGNIIFSPQNFHLAKIYAKVKYQQI